MVIPCGNVWGIDNNAVKFDRVQRAIPVTRSESHVRAESSGIPARNGQRGL
jgi:hypothetical protein